MWRRRRLLLDWAIGGGGGASLCHFETDDDNEHAQSIQTRGSSYFMCVCVCGWTLISSKLTTD